MSCSNWELNLPITRFIHLEEINLTRLRYNYEAVYNSCSDWEKDLPIT